MSRQFVDTNVFIRFLTRDHPVQAEACRTLFERARRNEIELVTTEAIIAEVVYVLSSRKLYSLSPEDVRARLYPLLSLPGLKILHRKTYLRALDQYAARKLDFEDAIAIAQMERLKIGQILTYDHEFDHVPGVERVEL